MGLGVLGLVLVWVGALPPLAVVLVVVLPAVGDAPARMLQARQADRVAWLEAHLPDLADRLATGLAAGMTMGRAVEEAVRTEALGGAPKWLVAELLWTSRLLHLSDHELGDALDSLHQRIPARSLATLRGQLRTAVKSGGRAQDALRNFARHERDKVGTARQAQLSLVSLNLLPALAVPVFATVGVSVHYLWTLVQVFMEDKAASLGVL